MHLVSISKHILQIYLNTKSIVFKHTDKLERKRKLTLEISFISCTLRSKPNLSKVLSKREHPLGVHLANKNF